MKTKTLKQRFLDGDDYLLRTNPRQIAGFIQFCETCQQLVSEANYLEIGSWVGESALMIGSFKFVKSITSIDQCSLIVDTYYNNLRCLNKDARFINKKSYDAVIDICDDSIDILYVDGEHTYDTVKRDLLDYYPKVKHGGVIGGHDYSVKSFPGVVQAVDEFCEEFGLTVDYKFIDTSFIIKKV
jgi:predicted O-methyltransferase YrrM